MLVLTVTAIFVALTPVTVVIGKPATLNIKAASSYQSSYTMFIMMFPEFTATNLHYNNPYLGSPQAWPAHITINLGSVSTKATGTNQHVIAQNLDASINLPILIEGFWTYKLVEIKCDSLVGDINLWTPDPNTGEFGILVATLKGKVLFHVPNIPGLPSGLAGGYHYEGNSLTISATLYEPILIVNLNKYEVSVPQGWQDSSIELVSILPKVEGITAPVGNFRFECVDKYGPIRGIKGWIEVPPAPPGTQWTPPLTGLNWPLTIMVEPWVKPGVYTGNVIVYDWIAQKNHYSGPIALTVTESGFTVTVDSSNPANLGDIPQGTSRPCTVTVTNWTDYTVGMGLNWQPIEGDFGGIGIEIPGGIQPPQTFGMKINVSPGAQPGVRKMDIWVFDGGLGKDFRCQVTFNVIESGFTVTVDSSNPADLGDIQRGTVRVCMVTVTPWTAYTVGMGLNWQPIEGDFNGIGIGMPGGIPPPPQTFGMEINVSPGAPLGVHKMDIWVADGGLGRDFRCQLTFNVIEPPP